ncbi:2-amino-4-hydroxy-6-hydroxymethyldihydropteridine diphosphokinase [Chitinivibrio alkaliphilus]|uniref:2-amino-4-hydroxy-6-hydroxymethyldihydropteridine pyrophosphokinase n=1 Tax=Chitinivibrio alkaliphilus ACht1 TaxID=1313304 RepID=U7D421_9BACT|nr:2-amino-4-hydroxy-6-hydroxymethyldihydropteridine diphosphokinase [Chitinivibrio alkaliphilus]ERP31259.1 2-amino-4-hydroxy-6-hydroxymethyldihydropteridine pyrophosphokinase [Chitinivibrio alkaliphilus ACht1]
MAKVVLSLGSNVGDRFFYIHQMQRCLEEIILHADYSTLFETAPVGVSKEHSPYLNILLVGFYEGSPATLLRETQRIESRWGRQEKGGYTPRTADIDILLFGCEEVHEPNLQIPHPALFHRRFILEGLRELVPHWRVGDAPPFDEYVIPKTILHQKITPLDL